MSFFPLLGSIVGPITDLVDDLFTSDEERLKAELEFAKLDAALITQQVEVNKVEAAHPSVFVAGWRPAIGWIGAAALAYQFVLYPLLEWGVKISQSTVQVPPALDSEILWTLVAGMLGIGGMRSFDKAKGTSTARVQK